MKVRKMENKNEGDQDLVRKGNILKMVESEGGVMMR